MKPLDELTSREKAKLLHQLFPSEMPDLVAFIQEICNTIEREEDIMRLEWDNQLLTAEFWFGLATQVNTIVDRYGNRLGRNSRLFAGQLFTGSTVILVVDAMVKYGTGKSSNPKFIKAVELLFY